MGTLVNYTIVKVLLNWPWVTVHKCTLLPKLQLFLGKVSSDKLLRGTETAEHFFFHSG